MPHIKKKELEKFMKDNPDSEATLAIKEQLGEVIEPETCTAIILEPTAGTGQIRNTASDLAAEKINKLHQEILNGFNSIYLKAIDIGEMLVKQKEALGHGQWEDWVDNHLDIGPRQVQNYAKIYNYRYQVKESMEELSKSGIKPSFRKMLHAATKKDNQSVLDYIKKRKKSGVAKTPQEKKSQYKENKRKAEILTVAKMYVANKIDDLGLKALSMKWNLDNHVDDEFYIEHVIRKAQQLKDSDQPLPSKLNIVISIDTNIWGNFLYYGGSEHFLQGYIHDFAEKYILEQMSLCSAN